MTDTAKKRLNIHLEAHMKEELDAIAREYGVPTSSFVTFLVGQYMAQHRRMAPMAAHLRKVAEEHLTLEIATMSQEQKALKRKAQPRTEGRDGDYSL